MEWIKGIPIILIPLGSFFLIYAYDLEVDTGDSTKSRVVRVAGTILICLSIAIVVISC